MVIMNTHNSSALSGAGLGLRRRLLPGLLAQSDRLPDFLELAPENWIGIGGRQGRLLAEAAERFPLIAHGLSLNIGGIKALDQDLLTAIKHFLKRFDCALYSEHLSYCADDGYLYELLPLSFTEETVQHVSARIRAVQDRLERRLVLENSSYYLVPEQQMSEAAFIQAVLQEADCELLLDVNNVVVNSHNHGYDAVAFIDALPAERIRYLHIAGHRIEDDGLRIDTHASAVGDEAWQLLEYTFSRLGPLPVLIERDSDFPPIESLLDEVARARALQRAEL